MDEKSKELLEAAANEIRSLRRANTDMAARLDTLEIVAAIAGFKRGSQGFGEDIAWKIDRFLIDNANPA